MDATTLTYHILAHRLFSWYDSKILVEWAVKLLENGFDSESLKILAGLDNDDTDIREKYFWKAVTELNISIEKQEIDLINFYVDNLVEEVIEGKVSPKNGLQKICEVARITYYSEKFMHFYLLAEDISYLEYRGVALTIDGLTKGNVDQYLINEFKLYKKMQNGDYSGYYNKAICNSCGSIMKPKSQTKYKLKIPFIFQVAICEFCDSQDIDYFSSQIGQEKIIAKLT